MSGFCGEFCFAGAGIDAQALAAMDSAMAGWGAGGQWQEGAVGLRTRLLSITVADAFECQPWLETDFALAGHVRLDARQALSRELGLPDDQLATMADGQLLGHAWRRWGEDCATHLYGDWVCAIWDRCRQSLWLGRDTAGNTGLYYWHDRQRLVFATSLHALLAHPAVPKRPNAAHIARQLAVIMDPAHDTQTAYLDIYRLPGGHALRCDREKTQVYAWWQPELLPEFAWANTEDYYAAFRELYAAAVNDRLQKTAGPIAVMFSAGRDSGSVAALAAMHEPILAYTSVPYFPPAGAGKNRLGDERALAQASAEYIGNVEFIPVAAEHCGVVAGIEAMLAVYGQPGHAAINYYWILEILRLAQQRGVRVVLTGQGGNATVSWAGIGNLWPSLRAGDWAACWAALRHSEVGVWPAVRRQLIKPALAPMQQLLSQMRPVDRAPWAAYSPIHPQFARQIGLYEQMRAAGHDPYFSSAHHPRHPRLARFRLGRLGSASVGSLWMNCGATHQLNVRDPTRDRRLLEFCWQVPDPVFWARGRQRGLLLKGMPHCLPERVLHARSKGLQAADAGYRILAEREQVETALNRIAGHPLAREWLDVARMRAVLPTLERELSPQTTEMAASILLRGLSVGLFLLRF